MDSGPRSLPQGRARCQPCRRANPARAKGPKGYIAPSRRGACAACGAAIQVTRTSAPVPLCRPCRSALPRAARDPRSPCVNCGEPSYGARCRTCAGAAQPSPRGSTSARGYGADHRAARRAWAAVVATGTVECWRCGERIPADAPWDLGHDDLDRTITRGPEHQRCNRATRGRGPNEPASIPYLPRGRTLIDRECEVCGDTYRPSHSGQRTCGRACGAELRRRNQPPRPPRRRPILKDRVA